MQPWDEPRVREVREQHEEFARAKLEGDRRERDATGGLSRERWKQLADFGTFGLCMPTDYGGAARPVTHAVAAIEGLGAGCSDAGFLYAAFNQVLGIQMTLRLIASSALQERYLPSLIGGDKMAAYCFTEEVSGSDAFSMETQAVEDGDGWVLTGCKRYITNAPEADLALLFAKTKEGRDPFGLTAFVVDMEWEGASHGEEFEKLGLRTVHMGELKFDEVRVPKDHVVGRVGAGLTVLAESTGWERGVLMACALAPMKRAIDQCVARARERHTYDKPIGAFQQISSKVANMVMRYKIARQLIYDMAVRLGDGASILNHLQDAAIVKLYVSENYVQTELDALQIFGVRGYLMEYFVQQDLRDALSSTIWAGTSESLRNSIAKFAGLPAE